MAAQNKSEQIVDIIFSRFQEHLFNLKKAYRKAYALFLNCDWQQIQPQRAEKITLYDGMVESTIKELKEYLKGNQNDLELWLQVKAGYIEKLYNYIAPELAETFYNSVFCHLHDRRYYDNQYIFVQPVFATKFLDIVNKKLSYKCISLVNEVNQSNLQKSWGLAVREMLTHALPEEHFYNLQADVAKLEAEFEQLTQGLKKQLNFQVRYLASLFFRNRTAYVIGNLINGDKNLGFLICLSNDSEGVKLKRLMVQEAELDFSFSSSRSNFTVDVLCPSAVIAFLNDILPFKKTSELYSLIGLHKQGKAEFYRDFLQHIKHSDDLFIPAPGIKGMVMSVFTLPSYPFVFKIIRDKFNPAKKITRKQVRQKYQIVKFYDRAGRMIDTLEFSDVAFPLDRFSDELIDYLQTYCAESLEIKGNQLIIRHIYIEKRVIPLDLYLKQARGDEVEKIIIEYGHAIKTLAENNIFVGDMFLKNFGVTQINKVVLYDYDDIEFITECNFRKLPQNSYEQSSIFVREQDVFPEQFHYFLFSNPDHKELFIKHHPEILTSDFWLAMKAEHEKKHTKSPKFF